MGDISKIRMGNEDYRLKDSDARADIGDIKSAISPVVAYHESIIYTSGAFIRTGNVGNAGTIVDLTPVEPQAFSYAVVPCSPGDKFHVTATGGNSARAWAWLAADNGIISNAASGAVDVDITAPANAAKLVLNNREDAAGAAYKYIGTDGFSALQDSVSGLQTDMSDLQGDMSSINTGLDSLDAQINGSSSAEPMIEFTSGGFIRTGNIGNAGTIVDLTPVEPQSFSYAVVSCSPGDKFHVTATGGNSARAWAWLAADNGIISSASSGAVNVDITAPANAAKLVLNNRDGETGTAYKISGTASVGLKKQVEAAKTIRYVSTAGSDNNDGCTAATSYATIGKAISETADVIYVKHGTYTEAQISENTGYRYGGVEIICDNATLIVPKGLHFRYADVRISGLTIDVSGSSSDTSYGFHLLNCTGTLSDCAAVGAKAAGGFRLDGSKMTLNRCAAHGCAIDGFNGHTVTEGYETDCTFIDCKAYDNGDDGLSIHESGRMRVIGGEYYNNVSTGIAPHQLCDFEIRGAYIHDNGTGVEAENPNYKSGDTKAVGLVIGCIVNSNNKTGRAQSDHIGYGVRAKQYVIHALANALIGNSSGTYYQDTGGEITVMPITAQ